jgi:hypothetical protein
MTDARNGYGDPSSKRSALQEPGCNDNDDPNHDNALSLAVPDVRTPNGSIIAISRGTAVKRDTGQLRELAGWYRRFAERAGSPNIWEGRVQTAEDLEEEACRIERRAM